GVTKWCRVQRFRCTECGKTFTRLPDFLLPFKRYAVREIEGVLCHLSDGGKLSESPSTAEESTLRRWWNEFSRKMQQWAGSVEAKVFKLSGQAPSFIKILSHPIKRLEKALSELPALPSWWAIMIKTLWWLHPAYPLCLG
ncbi:MAG: DUF6431 domain-containing protein, partial [bacterium]|nr:DUF6431 domain-containing protein [bacterium]